MSSARALIYNFIKVKDYPNFPAIPAINTHHHTQGRTIAQTSWTLPRVSAALLLKLVSEVTARGACFVAKPTTLIKPLCSGAGGW